MSVDPGLAAARLEPDLVTEVYRTVEEALAAMAVDCTLTVRLDAAGQTLWVSIHANDDSSDIGDLGWIEARVELIGARSLRVRVRARSGSRFPGSSRGRPRFFRNGDAWRPPMARASHSPRLQPEYAVGAIAEEGIGLIDRRAFEGLGVTELEIRAAARGEEVVCLHEPAEFLAVGPWYADFAQTPDQEVRELLSAHAEGRASAQRAERGGARSGGGFDWTRLERHAVSIPARQVRLAGDLRLPPAPIGLVIFAHGSDCSRLSPRNVQLATALGASGLATLLLDLLDEHESASRHNLFDASLLTDRLVAATAWAAGQDELRALPLGYFGASTGAAAALSAAAELGDGVRAVVSRAGRPDLAAGRLSAVTAPTLLIVGGDDWNVLALNEEASGGLPCPHELAIVPHAGHLFEEPGALERVTELAADWFGLHLTHAAGRDAA